jgi:hypothetical protein
VYIAVTAGTPRATRVTQSIITLAQAVAQIGLETAHVTQMVINGTDYTQVESLLGLQPGQGQSIYNLMVGANTVLQGSAVSQLINEVG